MRLRSLIFIITINVVMLLQGCINTHPVAATVSTQQPPGRIGLQLAPASLGQNISLQQRLTVVRAGQIHQLDTVLEINSTQLNLVGLMFGHRIMTLQYDGKTMQTWHDPRLPSQITGEAVLEDIELTLWPTAILRVALPPYWKIDEHSKQRILLLNNTPIVIIDYLDGRRWNGTVKLTNLRYHYQLTIQSVTN